MLSALGAGKAARRRTGKTPRYGMENSIVEVFDGAHLTAEDISEHQKNQKIRDFEDFHELSPLTWLANSSTKVAQTDMKSCTNIDGELAGYETARKKLNAVSKDIKAVLKKLRIKPRALKVKPPVPYVHGNFILRFPAESGDNSCGSVFNPPAADDEVSSSIGV